MQCPSCGHEDSKVTDSRTVDAAIRRRRECLRCSVRFTTYERLERGSILVVKKDGRREEFSREKLLGALRSACAKRPLETGAISALVDDVEGELLSRGVGEVASAAIGELVMDGLQQLDQIAYIRFACVYRAFTDLDSLRAALDELERNGGRNSTPREQLPLLPETELVQLAEPHRILPPVLPLYPRRSAPTRRRKG
jgi:transcriptional repressor NrdR